MVVLPSDDWIDGYATGYADAAAPLASSSMEGLAKEVAPMAARLRGAVDLLKIAVGCERFETCGGPTGQPICASCIQFAHDNIAGWGQ
jgi:hypothetical protein